MDHIRPSSRAPPTIQIPNLGGGGDFTENDASAVSARISQLRLNRRLRNREQGEGAADGGHGEAGRSSATREEGGEGRWAARNRELEKQLNDERESNHRLRLDNKDLERQLEERDWKITQLERELDLMHRVGICLSKMYIMSEKSPSQYDIEDR